MKEEEDGGSDEKEMTVAKRTSLPPSSFLLHPSPLRLGILGSGKGSNFRAIADAIAARTLDAEVRIVVSDMENAGILSLARERGLRAEFVAPGRFKTKLEPEAERRVVELLSAAGVELVVLAGYLRMIKPPLLDAFPRRIVNIHPSLLPAFPGLEAWTQAHAAGAAETGCTVHYVDAGMDSGEVIAQRTVPVRPGDTPATLHARIQEQEHQLYPAVIAELIAKLRGERAQFHVAARRKEEAGRAS